jgi:hypothetical protein
MAKDETKEEQEFSCKKISVWLSFGWARMIAKEGEAAREIIHREIEVLKVVRTGTLKVSKSQHNRDRPIGEDAWQRSGATGRSSTGGFIEESGIRVSRVP